MHKYKQGKGLHRDDNRLTRSCNACKSAVTRSFFPCAPIRATMSAEFIASYQLQSECEPGPRVCRQSRVAGPAPIARRFVSFETLQR